MSSDFRFAKTRRFAPLFGTQFFGAFNDNVFKTALFALISFYGLGKNALLPAEQMLNLGALLFILPYFLFSAVSGQISTRFNKARVAQSVKILEVVIMMLAGYGFYVQSASLLLLCLFLMGVQSTLFGPVKYAILPEYLQEKELLMGNGLIESGTFFAILFGQIVGTVIAGQGVWLAGGVVLLVAVFGLMCSTGMPSVAPKQPDLKIDANVWRSTMTLMRDTRDRPELFTAILGISWFWFVGSVYTTQLPTFVKAHLHGNAAVFNLMLTLFSIGIAVGSVVCAKISKGTLRLWLVSVGALGLAAFGCALVWLVNGISFVDNSLMGIFSFLAHGVAYPVMLLMVAIGFFGGFFSVPLYTWLQTASSEEFRAQAVAANNIVNAVFMVAAALISAVLLWAVHSILLLYLLVALGNVAFVVYLGVRSPQVLGRRDNMQ